MLYKINYTNPAAQYIHVQAIISTEKDTTVLQFPMWRPGRYEIGNFSKNIHSFEVLNDKGKKIAFEKTSKSTWKVQTENTKEITVRYRYFANELNAGSSFIDDLQLYVNPVNLLIYTENQLNTPCSLELSVPNGFKLACGAEHKNNVISCANYHELVDSPFIASPSLKKYTYAIKGVNFNLWFQGEYAFDEAKVLEDFKKFTAYQLDKFDNFDPEEYHFLFQILPIRAYHGVEHTTTTVIALGPGEALMTTLYDDFLGVSSHELYHVWNVKSIRPAEMQPYDYSRENYTHLGYVAEGVTTYMGDLILAASGVKDFKWYKKELEILLQRHFDNFGRFNYSVAESSFDTWLDGYVAGVPNRKVSIYNEGALLSLSVDALIREASNNKASLHDVMNAMHQRFGIPQIGYTADDFFALIEEFGGINISDVRNNYYYGTHSFEPLLVKAFKILGLDIKMEKNPSSSIDQLGVKTLPEGGKSKIINIYPGSGAELAGLMVNDVITRINDDEVNNNLDDLIKPLQDAEIHVSVNRMGRNLKLFVPHTNKSYYPIYKVIKDKVPSNLSKRIFKSWCGSKWEDIEV